ncbi:MAG: septal ring lytic transglycosylase RlpA family protein [Paraprevotella sp.]|nr:septal ring lytic transglycosylase RlpA family protein [Paraprevotella sp.]
MYPVQSQEADKGKASFYSNKLHGRLMSNGEPYHRDSMTCAHLKYPLGTMLRVKNVQNGKEVVVEVTDRGPHIKKYMIDLSYAAARELGFTQSGFCLVEVTPCYIDQVPYCGEKPEYELPRPEYDTLRPIRTWNHPIWQKTNEGTKVRGEDQPTDDNQR